MKVTAPGRLGPYELVSLLGAGGMGVVYRAHDPRLKRDVALKVLADGAAIDPSRQRRFLQESQAAGALNHPNIVAVYDVGAENGVHYFVSELVEGSTLRQELERGPLPLRRLIEYAAQIGDGLAAAHDAGLVHRDLKPENVMVTAVGRVKILDFGLAKTSSVDFGDVTTTQSAVGLIVGTAPYMSPEQARGAAVDWRSDQFSFGTMLYEMATGRQAFRRETAAQTLSAVLEVDPPPMGEVNPAVPVPLRWVIERCLRKNVEERYASTADLSRDLHTIRDRLSELGLPPVATPLPATAGGTVAPATGMAAAARSCPAPRRRLGDHQPVHDTPVEPRKLPIHVARHGSRVPGDAGMVAGREDSGVRGGGQRRAPGVHAHCRLAFAHADHASAP